MSKIDILKSLLARDLSRQGLLIASREMLEIIIEQQSEIEKLQSEVYLSNIGSIRMEND